MSPTKEHIYTTNNQTVTARKQGDLSKNTKERKFLPFIEQTHTSILACNKPL
jgi:hypothetical protein